MSYQPARFDFSIPIRVNLSSDTQTKPSARMKQAMMEAEIGDEQIGSDHDLGVVRPCRRAAGQAGRDVPADRSMCNQIALATHCRPGDEVLAHETAHIQGSEGGAPGAVAGVMVTGLGGPRGMFTAKRWPRRFALPAATVRRSAWSR